MQVIKWKMIGHFTRLLNSFKVRYLFRVFYKKISNIFIACILGVGITFLFLCIHIPTKTFGLIILNPVKKSAKYWLPFHARESNFGL